MKNQNKIPNKRLKLVNEHCQKEQKSFIDFYKYFTPQTIHQYPEYLKSLNDCRNKVKMMNI